MRPVLCARQGCGTSAALEADKAAAGGGAGEDAGSAASALSSGGLLTPVELSISAEGLAETDALSAPDPMAVVYEKTHAGLVEIGRTEVICKSGATARVGTGMVVVVGTVSRGSWFVLRGALRPGARVFVSVSLWQPTRTRQSL